MPKWCLNYESGDYEYIERDGFSIDRGSTFIIGMTASIAARKKRKKNAVERAAKTIGNL